MNVLILFEESGAIRDRVIDAGHFAISVDLKPGRGKHTANHIKRDVFAFCRSQITNFWDMIIAHPPCTALAVSGNRYYAGTQERQDAIRLVERLWSLPVDKLCIENPVGVLSTQSALGKPTQYIQPWQFGHNASKKTGLWTRGLPSLKPTTRISGRMIDGAERWGNQCDSGQNKLGPSDTRAQQRSETYAGIADAIVNQWIEG